MSRGRGPREPLGAPSSAGLAEWVARARAAGLELAWLMKTEPETFGIAELERDGAAPWDGVRNYLARNLMRDHFRLGDQVLVYHSNGRPSGVAGLGRVVGEAEPDRSALDPTSPYFDPRATEADPRWWMVRVGFSRRFPRVVALEALKADPVAREMMVCERGTRLSIQPVTPRQLERVLQLADGL